MINEIDGGRCMAMLCHDDGGGWHLSLRPLPHKEKRLVYSKVYRKTRCSFVCKQSGALSWWRHKMCLATNTSLLSCFYCWWRHCLLSIIAHFPLSFFVVFMLLTSARTLHLPHLTSYLPTFCYITSYLTLPHILPFVTLPCTLPYLTFCHSLPYLCLTLPYFLPYLTISLTLHFALPYLTS